jgi:8-oxo-dGTP diphosphatase
MTAPQFGAADPGRTYADRPAAFGIAVRGGLIALVRITKSGHPPWLDLPGGALDPGESARQALAREFGEETGLRVQAGPLLALADQFFINTEGEAFNNRASIFEAIIEGEAAGLKIEEDHELVWLNPGEALRGLRHDAHAWGVAAWLRKGSQT